MSDDAGVNEKAQHIVRVPGSRRARLTPVPGTDTAPDDFDAGKSSPAPKPDETTGPNDDRLMRDVPPHY